MEDLSSPTEQLDRTTASSAVAERLRSEIQRGNLQPGTRLPQGDIAKRYGVSTTPVREAFQILQAEGLLRIDPHRGAIVFRPTVEEMQEEFGIRSTLEQLAAAKAIPNLKESDFAELDQMIHTMRATNDPAQWRQLNTQFHTRIYESSRWPRLVGLISNLADATSGYSQMATLRAPRSWWADTQHEQILDALRAGNVERTQEIISDHLHLTVTFLIELLEGEEGASQSPNKSLDGDGRVNPAGLT